MTDLPEEAVEAGAQALHAIEVSVTRAVLSAALETGAIVTRERYDIAAAETAAAWECEQATAAGRDALRARVEELEAGLREQRRGLRARVEELEGS